MSFEYKNIPPKRKESKKDEAGVTRRGFLKAGLAFGASAVAGRVVQDYLEEKEETSVNIKEIPSPKKEEPPAKYYENASATPEQEEIFAEDMEAIESIADILNFDRKEPIELTPEKMEGVKNYWKENKLASPVKR